MVAVVRASTGLTTHRPDQRKGASLVPRLARPARSSRPGNPCASRMISLESPVPETGTPGSESGGRKRAHGDRTAARCESAGSATDPLPVTRLPSTLLATVTWPLGGGTGTGLGHGQRAMSSGRPLERLNRAWQGG